MGKLNFRLVAFCRSYTQTLAYNGNAPTSPQDHTLVVSPTLAQQVGVSHPSNLYSVLFRMCLHASSDCSVEQAALSLKHSLDACATYGSI